MIYIKYCLARLGLAIFYTFQSVPSSITYFYRADLIRTQAQTLEPSWHWSNSNLSVYFYPIQIILHLHLGEEKVRWREARTTTKDGRERVTLD